MEKDLFDQIIEFLTPEMDDAGDRKALIQSALHNSPILGRIRWDGATRSFTVHLMLLLDQFGEVAPGKPAIVALLEKAREQVGADKQAQVDNLLARLKSSANSPAFPRVNSIPTPVETEKAGTTEIYTSEPQKPIGVAVATGLDPRRQTDRRDSSEIAFHPGVNTPRWPRKQPFQPRILVMKGGGVKGIAYVGAIEALEEHGYRFDHFVGTSAGAISAALLAVGYTSKELEKILEETDFKEFKDGWLLSSLLLLPFRKGLYRGEAFRGWMEKLLRKKFPGYAGAIPIQFKHLNESYGKKRRLTVFASCKDRSAYHFDSKTPRDSDREISYACRCSMAIPYFFMPERIDGKRVVDGGMQNNYPIDALLKYFPELRDTSDFIGLYLGPKNEVDRNSKLMLLDLLSIWSESGDEESKTEFIDRTIVIDPRPVKTTDFSLSPNDVKFLLAEGRASALHWLYHWSDKKGQLTKVVEEAKLESDELRALVIKERWRKFLPKLAIAILVLVLLLAGIVYYWFQR
jgi:predicted acylesterase/phospholipase RssA